MLWLLLTDTTDMSTVDVHIVDNNSTDGTGEWLKQWEGHNRCTLHLMPKNLGIPRALNYVMERFRSPGQHVIKFDNDVECKTKNWLGIWIDFLNYYKGLIAQISAWYPGLAATRTGRKKVGPYDMVHIFPPPGRFVLLTGAFMDRIGYFDVFSPDHLYGYEDSVVSWKARKLGWAEVAILSVCQNYPSRNIPAALPPEEKMEQYLGEGRVRFLRRMEVWKKRGDNLYTGSDGKPGNKK